MGASGPHRTHASPPGAILQSSPRTQRRPRRRGQLVGSIQAPCRSVRRTPGGTSRRSPRWCTLARIAEGVEQEAHHLSRGCRCRNRSSRPTPPGGAGRVTRAQEAIDDVHVVPRQRPAADEVADEGEGTRGASRRAWWVPFVFGGLRGVIGPFGRGDARATQVPGTGPHRR